jgi:hypothetical protein
VADRDFTPGDVERLIPALAHIMGRLMEAHAEAAAVRKRHRDEQQRITMSGGGVVDQAAWRARTEELARLTQLIEDGLQEIVALGGIPKDLGLGLVDFPHVREGRVVNLCWKYGEKEIRYWHGLGEGYAARKPL